MRVQVQEVWSATELGTSQPLITGIEENIFEAEEIQWEAPDDGPLNVFAIDAEGNRERVATFYRWTKVTVLDHPAVIGVSPPSTDPVLDCPMDGNDADAPTVREYLKALLNTLMNEGEGFSGKRPFGNSGWEYDMETALIKAGLASGETQAAGLILEAITRL